MVFVNLFYDYLPSELKLLKLYNWCYHIIAAIKEYSTINRFTIETYEFLHKDAIKKPYQASNKCHATSK